MIKKWGKTLSLQNKSFYSYCQNSVGMRERQGDGDRRRTVILTLNLLTTLCFHTQDLSTFSTSWPGGHCTPLGIRRTFWISESLLIADCQTDCTCRGYLHIWFHSTYAFPVRPSDCHPTHLLPPVYTGASCLRSWNMTVLSKVKIQYLLCSK